MRVEVKRLLGVDWPTPMGPQAEPVFEELIVRLDGVRWFLMGRTLLQLVRSKLLDDTDSDIDFGVRSDDFEEVRGRLDDWPFAIETNHRGQVQQALWYPNQVLVDCHVFYPTVSYVSMGGKYVTRRTTVFDTEPVKTPHGVVPLPGDPERFLLDDYGKDWRTLHLPRKSR